MDERTLRVLEWHKVLEELSGCCSTELGRMRVEELKPSDDRLIIKNALEETTSARAFLDSGRQVVFGGVKDIRDIVVKAEKGLVLSGLELSAVYALISRARAIRKQLFLLEERFSPLKELVWNIREHKDLEAELDCGIGPGGEVLDGASPELGRIRSRINTLNSRLRDKLDQLIKRPEIAKYLQEPIVSLRGGRFVVPVRAEYKGQVKGIVHDQSASGATIFIEPISIVEANNDLRGAEAAEIDEIEKVLSKFSAMVGDAAADIILMLDCLSGLDFALAKGKYSQITDSAEPILAEDQRFRFEGARHPLLKGTVVPIDAYVGEGFTILVITGPNTGGKTVALKTMGLLQVMAQSGLHVPALAGCSAAVFDSVYADIGDEQSIEQSLSTFSGHMTNIVEILRKADDKSLVLLDELGAGTDPEEGAALAMAILDDLYSAGANVVATTHYKELKVFAHLKPGMRNASVEFDIESLKPTYRLSIGMPGSSNAFAIAERLGLQDGVISKAKSFVKSEDRKVEDMINSLRQEYEAAATARKDADILKRRAEESSRKLSDELSKQRSEKAEIMQKTRAEARELVKLARQEVEQIIGELKTSYTQDAQETARAARKAVESLKEFIDEIGKEGSDERTQVLETDIEGLKAGDPIEILPSGIEGVLLEIKGDKARAAVGSIRTELPISMIRKGKIKGEKKQKAVNVERQTEMGMYMAQNISVEIDLRGMKADEAIEALDKRLDDAVLAGIPMLRVIHGKGTGALRAAVRDRLLGDSSIESFRLGAEGEGGDGVTIIKFRQ